MLDNIVMALSIISVTCSLFIAIRDIRRKVTSHTGKTVKCGVKTKKILWYIMFGAILGAVTTIFVVGIEKTYMNKFGSGMNMMNKGEYEQAQEIFDDLNEDKLQLDAQYNNAKKLYDDGKFQEASRIFEDLGDYKSSEQYLQMSLLAIISDTNDVQESQYSVACDLYDNEKFCRALNYFEKLDNYKDSIQMKEQCIVAMQEMSAHTISAGISFAIGIKEDKTVVSAGSVESSNFADWENIISVSNLGVITIGLKDDGTVITFGDLPVDVNDWNDIVAVSAGERYVVGLKQDGTVVGAGHDQGDGQLEVDGWTDIVAIATGWRHTVGLDSDGEVHITGYGSHRQLKEINDSSEWENIIAVAAGGGGAIGKGHTVGLRADGTVVAVGDNTYGQCNVSEWKNIKAIAAGDWHTIGLCEDGTVVSTKPNSDKYPSLYTAACDVENLEGVVEIAAGTGYTIALKKNGTVEALGYNDNNQRDKTEDWENMKVRNKEFIE